MESKQQSELVSCLLIRKLFIGIFSASVQLIQTADPMYDVFKDIHKTRGNPLKRSSPQNVVYAYQLLISNLIFLYEKYFEIKSSYNSGRSPHPLTNSVTNLPIAEYLGG